MQHPGDLGDPGAGPNLAAGVIGGRPCRYGDLQDGVLDVLSDGEPDGVGQAASWLGEPGQVVVGAATGVSADSRWRGSWASANWVASMWPAAVLESAFSARNMTANGSPEPSAP